jgi:diguanylate cyclase (GGDEF)-like protein
VGKSKGVKRFVIYNAQGVILADSTVVYRNYEAPVHPDQAPDPFGQQLVLLNTAEPIPNQNPPPDELVLGAAIYLNDEIIGAVSVAMSTENIQKKIRTLIEQSTRLAMFIILAGILVSIYLARALSRPLGELMDVASEMASGNSDIRVNVNSTDEIGKLGDAFNEMTEAIQMRERDLRNLTASLEQKVNERTDELRQRNQELLTLATSDPLTQINNRRNFFTLAGKEYERATRYKHPLSLVIADVDHFKEANDTYGHQVGDKILANLAAFLEKNIRNIDIVARYGGEEFIILMPEISCEYAKNIAERLRRLVEETPMAETDYKIMLTVSFGVACWEQNKELTLDTLIYRADKALYKAKRDGRNRVTVWQESLGI